jgi:hypothetical protein
MADDFTPVHLRLRAIMLAAAPTMIVNKDEPGSLELRTPEIDPKTKQPGWFGTVTTKKNYVAVHLMPLYFAPELGTDISQALSKRRQGKSCFNFSQIDEHLFDELSALAQRCASV